MSIFTLQEKFGLGQSGFSNLPAWFLPPTRRINAEIHSRHVGIVHRCRDTFALDLLSRGSWAHDVAKLLGDTAETVEKHHAPFVRELRERTRRVTETRSTCHLCQHRHRWQVLLHVFYTVLLLAVPLHAPKPRPEQHLFSRRVFVAGISLLAAPKTAGPITTRQLFDRAAWENNPTFRRYPSPAKQAGIKAGIFAAQSFAFYLTEHNRHAPVRWTGRALIAHAMVEHSRLAACNAGINTHSPVIQSCRPAGW